MLMKQISARAKDLSNPFGLVYALPKDVIRLTAGEPDFDTPDFIREAARKAMDEGFTHYSPSSGYEDLRKAVAEKLRRENGIDYDYDKEIVITPGSASGIFLAMLALLDPGDEVLVPDPAWFHYRTLIRCCGAKPVNVPVKFEEGTMSLDLEEMKRSVTSRTKMLVLNSPSNPTGMMLSGEALREFGDFAEKHDFWILSDEVYEKIVYPGSKHISPASLPGLKERTLTSNGFSKGYAMTGWRIGYLAGLPEVMDKVSALSGYILNCPSSISQRAALAALMDSRMEQAAKMMVERFTKRREMVLEALSNLPGIKAYQPRGAFYVWIDITGTGMSSEEFSALLLEKEKVGLLPGPLFGELGKGHVRISFATGEDKLQEALTRFRKFVLAQR
jgi:aspartate/methionine/tyrosine aminotransferase